MDPGTNFRAWALSSGRYTRTQVSRQLSLFSAIQINRNCVLGILLSCAIVVASGCGFHLRGTQFNPVNIESLVLSCDVKRGRDFCLDLRRQIQQQEIHIAEPGSDQATELPILTILNIDDRRRAASLASDASAAEIEFSREVSYSVKSPRQSSKNFKARQARTYQYSELSVLGKEKEEQDVLKGLNRRLSAEILQRSSNFLSTKST